MELDFSWNDQQKSEENPLKRPKQNGRTSGSKISTRFFKGNIDPRISTNQAFIIHFFMSGFSTFAEGFSVSPLKVRCFCFFSVRLGSALHCRWASKYQGEAPPCGASCNWKVTILERGCFLMPELCESFSYFQDLENLMAFRELDTHQNYPKQRSGGLLRGD